MLGLRQEGQAADAVAALQQTMIVTTRVTRGGELQQIPADRLVPSDLFAVLSLWRDRFDGVSCW